MSRMDKFAASLLIVRQAARIAGVARQPSDFLYRSKESNQRNDLRCAGHLCLRECGVFAVGCDDCWSGAAWQRNQGGLFH